MSKIVTINQDKLLMLRENMASNESVASHDEYYGSVTLYHGTDILALVEILKSNIVCANKGIQHGETQGVNWFSLVNDGSFNRGACFSIDVPQEDFDLLFRKMNNVHVTTKESSLDISSYDIKVVYFCGFSRESLTNLYNRLVDKGERYPIEWMRDSMFYHWCEKTNKLETYQAVSDEGFGIIMANILGDDAVRKEGFLMEAAPEVDEYEIGDEGNNPPVGGNFYHVNEAYNVSVRGDLDSINVIEFVPHENAREEGYEDDEIQDFEPYYEIEAKDIDYNTILYADLTVSELYDYFPQSIINDIVEKNARLSNPSINEYRIEDILYRDTTPSDINNVEEVNRIAKKIQTGGPSAYLLTDGDVISFQDHIYITSVDGVTPSSFIGLGNIRLTNGGFELAKEPTRQQISALKQWIRNQSGSIHIDFCEDVNQTYPNVLFGARYGNPNPERIINDIIYYYEDGVKPQGDNYYEGKEKKETITENSFNDWFGSSILKDEEGNPLKMYHGTDAEFDSFSHDFIGSTGSFEGYGFNFTPYYNRAASYNSKRVIEAYLKVEHPMTTKNYNISLKQLIQIIAELDKGKPYTDTIVAAYEPSRYGEKWDEKYYRRALPIAAKTIYQYNKDSNYGDAGLYAEICLNGNADKHKTIKLFERLGYDSAIFYNDMDNINTVVVFEPNQIKLTTNKTYNLDSNVMGENIQSKNNKLVLESQESKSIAAAKKLVMQRLNYNEQEADEFIRIKLRNDIPTLRTPQGGKFILGVTRMFCDGELRTANDIGNLNSTLKLVASDAHVNEYDRNLNGMSCQELIQRFSKAMSNNLDAEKTEIGQMVFDTPSNYEIVKIDSFEQAEEYGRYTSWCVTHQEDMFDSYTNNGINQFYFCLKNGFENVKEISSEGCPLDEYGLSMIAVSVNENGMLNTCTCRWNHDNGGNDSIMNAKEVSQVIGMNFFEVFKPNNKWKDLISDIMQCLANGEDPRNVLDYVFDFREGFARVLLDEKYNFINQEGRLLSDQWFDYVEDFREGFARVNLNGKYNFINQEGRFLSEQWFDSAYGWFNGGYALVNLNEKYNFINQEGRLLSEQWFDSAFDFREGFARVKLNGKYNFINQGGRFLSEQWFDYAYDFREGFASADLNGNNYVLDTNGNLKLKESKSIKKSILVSENKLSLLKENLDLEVDSSEIDLSSFKKKHELAPNIWKSNGKLSSRVRLKLLDIADDFWKYVNLTWVKPKAIILTGSICNFNWSQYSDIDLHLIVDFNEVDEKTQFVKDYLDSKKNEWNNEHDNLQIMGYKVELYVQDSNDVTVSSGIYDLEENDWIKEPNEDDIKPIELDKFAIKDKAAKIMTIIDDMYDSVSSIDDVQKLKTIGYDATYLLKKIKDMRQDSLELDGESGSGNIVYKILRREFYLDKLWRLKVLCYDKLNSI